MRPQIIFLDERLKAALKENRRCLHQRIADSLIPVLIAGEDRRFWNHEGIDVMAIARALIHFVFYRQLQGASTIEQQLVRTLTGFRKLSLRRKLREMVLACVVGRSLRKREIAILYLCCAYYGWQMNSLEQACHRLGFDIASLSLSQAADVVARLKYPEPKFASASYRSLIANRAAYILRKAERASAV